MAPGKRKIGKFKVFRKRGNYHSILFRRNTSKRKFPPKYEILHKYGHKEGNSFDIFNILRLSKTLVGFSPITDAGFNALEYGIGLYDIAIKRNSKPLENIIRAYPSYRSLDNINDFIQEIGKTSLIDLIK